MEKVKTLIEEYHEQLDRVKQLLTWYEEIPEGVFWAITLRKVIADAEKARNEDNVVDMLKSLQEMKDCE